MDKAEEVCKAKCGKEDEEDGQESEGQYEALRAANIKRNYEIMRALGLDLSDFRLHKEHQSSAGDPKIKGAKSSAPRKRSSSDDTTDEGVNSSPATRRKSARISGVTDSQSASMKDRDNVFSGSPIKMERLQAQMVGTDEQHDELERDHLRWAGRQSKATIVGTASYKHTLHRVMTMSPDALSRRIKAIERACGQHAVVKMRLFARVLCLEGHDDLAAEATAAFERLVAKVPLPQTYFQTHIPHIYICVIEMRVASTELRCTQSWASRRKETTRLLSWRTRAACKESARCRSSSRQPLLSHAVLLC